MATDSYRAVEYNNAIASEIDVLAAPLLKYFNITTFAHIKIFEDSLFHVTNNCKWLEFYCANKFFNSNHYQHEINQLSHSYFVLRNDKASLIKSMHTHDVWHGLSIYKKYDDHIEMWNFATLKDNVGIYNFYLNQMNYLERFIVYFKNKAKDLIEHPKEEVLLKREQKLTLNNDEFAITQVKRDFLIETKLKKMQLQGLKVNISKREIECLHFLSHGKTLKEIAAILHISPRTTEAYVDHLKKKLGCFYRTDLVTYYEKNLKNYFIAEFES